MTHEGTGEGRMLHSKRDHSKQSALVASAVRTLTQLDRETLVWLDRWTPTNCVWGGSRQCLLVAPRCRAKTASMYPCLWMHSVFSSTKTARAGCAAGAGKNNTSSRPHVSGGPPVSLQGCAALHRAPGGVPELLWLSLLLNSRTRQHRPFHGV